jgi:hypothetical protein
MAGNPLTNPNWAPELADTVERLVGQIRDKATNKVVLVVRAVVFGFVIALTALAALVLMVILGTKLLQRIVNIGGAIDADSSVWVSYLVMGGILVLVGLFLMRKRSTPDDMKASK